MNNVRELNSVEDPLWPQWKEIYLASFPPNERMTLGYFEQAMAQTGTEGDRHILAMVVPDLPDKVVCIGYYEMDSEQKIAFMWYLATRDGVRNNGYGAGLYGAILEASRTVGADLLVFEVEIPALAADKSPEDAELAARRIRWYERQGALMVHGIRYLQDVDSTDELTPMHLMVHCDNPPDPESLYKRLSAFFGEAIERLQAVTVGPLEE